MHYWFCVAYWQWPCCIGCGSACCQRNIVAFVFKCSDLFYFFWAYIHFIKSSLLNAGAQLLCVIPGNS